MDYEKKVAEALEELKQCDRYDTEPAKTILKLFPELEESDYVIKQRLRKYLEYFRCKGIDHNVCDRILKWLDKQDEQKSNPYSGVSFEYNGHIWGMCARDGGVEIGCDKQLIAYVNLPQEKDEFDNFSKPIDNKDIGCNTVDFMYTAPNHDI